MEQNVYLFHFFVILCLSLCSLKFSYKILSQKLFFTKTVNLSPLIIVYFILILLQSISSILLYLYSIIFWRPDTVIYDARILLVLGLSCAFFLFLHPIIEIFLCIDRCFAVIFPLRYRYKEKMTFFVITLILLGIIGAGVLVQVYMINTFPSTPATSCRVYYCLGFFLSQKYSMIVKIVIASISVLSSLFLALLINKFMGFSSTPTTHKINKTICFMVFASICLDFSPNVIGQVFQNVTQMNLLDFIGPYTLICGTLNVTFCSGIYFRVIKASINPSVVATVSSFKP